MSPHNKNNLYEYSFKEEKNESLSESLFTFGLMLGTVVIICLVFLMSLPK